MAGIVIAKGYGQYMAAPVASLKSKGCRPNSIAAQKAAIFNAI